MNKEALKKFIDENPKLVSMKETSKPGLFVLKYKRKVFYDSLWNDLLEECRGTIVDADYNVISRPFTKIYNYGIESRAPILPDETVVTAHRKINGFMVAVTWHDNDLLISTTGSIDSDYIIMALQLMDPAKYREVCKAWHGTTFMFECVNSDDPHIIPEEEGMYLLGYREKSWDSKCIPDYNILQMLSIQFGCKLPEMIKITLGALKSFVKEVEHEGYVFYTDDGISSKIKSPYYLTSKFVARAPNIDKLMRADIKQNLDEEYYPLIDAIQANIDGFSAMDEQDRLLWVRGFFGK